MKKISILLALLMLLGVLAATNLAQTGSETPKASPAQTPEAAEVPSQATEAPAAKVAEAPTAKVTQEFSDLLLWFLIALVAITIISAVRIFLLKRKNPPDKEGKVPPPPQRQVPPSRNNPSGLPPRPAKPTISWTFIIVLVMLVVMMVFSYFSGKEQIGEANYSAFMTSLRNGQVKTVTFTESTFSTKARMARNFTLCCRRWKIRN